MTGPHIVGPHSTVSCQPPPQTRPLRVLTFYRFTPLTDGCALRRRLLALCRGQGLCGTILLSGEGINGTVAGCASGISVLQDWFAADTRFADMPCRPSTCREPPFRRMHVKWQRELVSLGVPGLDPARRAGTRCRPHEWPELLRDPRLLLLDVRNRYEVAIGSFRNALAASISRFREFPAYVRTHLSPRRQPRVAMFCTGGIRCEKASAFLLEQGFREVFQLDGGILAYLAETGNQGGHWQGECFVFDARVALDEQLEPGRYTQCFACRHPLGAEHRRAPEYQPGLHCPFCIGTASPEKLARCAERHRQRLLARTRASLPAAVPPPAPMPAPPYT